VDVRGNVYLPDLLKKVILRSGPGFNRAAFCCSVALWSANRSANVWGCERVLSMRSSFPTEMGGSATGVLITDECLGTVR
jgi:hypothetical protein